MKTITEKINESLIVEGGANEVVINFLDNLIKKAKTIDNEFKKDFASIVSHIESIVDDFDEETIPTIRKKYAKYLK